MKYVSVGHVYNPGNLPANSLTKANVRFATHVLLPFRLRTGPFRRFVCDAQRKDEVCLRNKVVVPSGDQPNDLVLNDIIEANANADLMTEAFVVEGSPQPTKDEVASIRECVSPMSPAEWFDAMKGRIAAGDHRLSFSPLDIGLRHNPHWPKRSDSSALTVLNKFLVGYERATDDRGGIPPLRRLTSADMVVYTSVHWLIICDTGYHLADAEIMHLLDVAKTAELYKKVLSPSQLLDLPEDILARVPDTIAERGHYLFQEFAFEAARHWQALDLLLAVVYAVLALEGAHAEFLRAVMSGRLDPGLNADELTTDLLRKLGLSTLFKLTPSLFMDEAERPPADLLKRCEKAINIRNGYVHSSHKKKGKYKVHTYTGAEFFGAYQAVVQVYGHYVRALDARSKAKGQ